LRPPGRQGQALRAKNAGRVVAALRSTPVRTTPRFLACDGHPPRSARLPFRLHAQHGRADRAASARERNPVPEHQCLDAVVGGDGEGLRLAHLDDVQTGARLLNAHVRKGEHGSLVVYADRITCTEIDSETGEDTEREIPFMKGYTVFNVEQIEGLPEHYYAKTGHLQHGPRNRRR
jgi:hypothetical protein